MKIFNTLTKYVVVVALAGALISCEQEQLDDALSIAPGGGTLTNYMAYSLDSIPGEGEVYGRIVFWQALDGGTLVQLSLYNVPTSTSFPSGIFGGTVTTPSSEMMALYNVENTGEGYDFGEFATSKFYVIDDEDFYDGLESLDANVQVMASDTDATLITAGDIGVNSTPVETN